MTGPQKALTGLYVALYAVAVWAFGFGGTFKHKDQIVPLDVPAHAAKPTKGKH